jgi:hypothetical protein
MCEWIYSGAMQTRSTSSGNGYFVWSGERVGEADRVPEDVAFVDTGAGVFAVADGVTRDRLRDGRYPKPSPARLAAEAFCEVIREHAPKSMRPENAFREANIAIERLNRRLGLYGASNYLDRDLAGAVAAVARPRAPSRLEWAYLGDAGIALIGPTGALLRETKDEIANARADFPTDEEVTDKEQRRVVIRSELRNNPKRRSGGYGVLTGEEGALAFLRQGSWSTAGSHVAVVFSDGFRPLLKRDDVRKLLPEAADKPEARRLLEETCDQLRVVDPSAYGKEASVIVWKTARREATHRG